MKVLDFETRSAIAKECIHKVCQASASLQTDSTGATAAAAAVSRRKSDRKITR